ncbi:small ribosomal subunit protein bS18m [Mantella aurantiaca]
MFLPQAEFVSEQKCTERCCEPELCTERIRALLFSSPLLQVTGLAVCAKMLVFRLWRGAMISRPGSLTWCRPVSLYSTGTASPVTPDSIQSSPNLHKDRPEDLENPFKEPPKKCILCDVPIDYKNVQLLSQFVSPHTGRIYGRHITGLCNRKQKAIAKAIKRSQIMGFMAVTYKDPAFLKDPKICKI